MKKNLKLILNEFKITLFCLMPLHLISKITFFLSRLENSFIKVIVIINVLGISSNLLKICS